MATFQDWLAQNGYRYQEGDDASYIFTPDGQRISANNNDATYAQLQNQFQLSQQYANPDIWGTMGSYYGGLSNVGSDGGEGIGGFGTAAGPDGYVRTGTAENSRFDAFGGGYQYDPTYGWIVPSSVASAYGDAGDDSMNYFLAALGGVAAPYAASTGLMSFGGMGGENVLNGMDLSSGLTNLDDFSYSTLTSGLEGAGGGGSSFPFTGGIDDFGMDTLPGLIEGGPVSTVDGMATGFGGSVPSWLQNLMPSGSSLTSLLGKVLPSALGAYGANQQANSYQDMMNQYFSLGAPYRSLLQQSYQPGFDISKEPGFQNAMDTTMNTYMRAASAGNAQGVAGGNPFNNPGAFMESQKYLAGNLALPYLQNYRSGLSSSGQLGLGPAAQFGGNSIQSQGGVYDAIGYGLGEVFNPKPDYMKQFAQMFQPKLANGGQL
jgi:hypothetical protein